ncbi:MAG: flagellar biosynthetic protein FliR, partial [Pirellulales bacterium]|nr:flagellar biosynthetic protein FliR [Pirellulales bacterium]
LHEMVVHMVSESFRLALRIGAPIITALLASTLVIGLAGRALPQINSFSIGLTVNLWTTFLTLFFSLTVVAYLFQDYVLAFLSTWKTML